MATTAGGQECGDLHGGPKGVVSLLQEFVQCSRQFHAPQHRPILQWNFDTRMVDFTALEFRACVAFILDGIPHHVAGAWHLSKKLAQRDTAERSLGFFIGRWGEQLLREGSAAEAAPPPAPRAGGGGADAEPPEALEQFCRHYDACGGAAPRWSHARTKGGACVAQAELSVLGVPHKFAGGPQASPEAARADTARRVLWYFQVPGYEQSFAPDLGSPAVTGKEIPAAPENWASGDGEGCAVLMAEKKTALMRVQNRLQQAFAKQLRPGQSVWEWSFEMDEDDASWPPLCRATARVPTAGRSFRGAWARGQRDAQAAACEVVARFLAGGSLHGGSSLTKPAAGEAAGGGAAGGGTAASEETFGEEAASEMTGEPEPEDQDSGSDEGRASGPGVVELLRL